MGKSFSLSPKEQKLKQKISQLQNKHDRLLELYRYRQGINTVSLRKARTRTLIQLGGLIEKANLLQPLDISLGVDLQNDETYFDSVSTLMGALAELFEPLQNDSSQKHLWQEKGKKLLAHK